MNVRTRRIGLTAAPGPGLIVGLLFGLPVVLLGGTPPIPSTGAKVDESPVQKIYQVDAANADAADDDKHGTPEDPLATIAYACRLAARDKDHHIGAKVLVAPGTYRESIEIGPPPGGVPDTDAPLVIESAERGQAVIDGADTGGWTPSTWKAEGANWTHPWPFRRNPPPTTPRAHTPPPVGAPPGASGEAYRRGDLVVINGILMRQVNRLEDLAPGCFWWRAPATAAARRGNGPPVPGGVADAGATVIVQPPGDASLDGAIIQVGTRAHGLVIRGRRNVVVRGLLFQHAAVPSDGEVPASGLLLDGCSNVLIEDVYGQWNDGAGLVIIGRAAAPASADFTLRQVHLLHNGGSGLAISNVGNLLVEDGEACFNNFRGEWAGWIDPAVPAGVKTAGVLGSTWRRLRAIGNACRGVWWESDNANVLLEESTIRDNAISGLLIGNNPGPALVRRCLVTGTKTPLGLREETAWPGGISMGATPDVTLESNVVAGNAVAQLCLWDTDAHPAATVAGHAIKASLRAERHAYHHNVFYGADASQAMYDLPGADAGGKIGWGFYYDTLDASENCFWNPAQAEEFLLRGNPPKPGGAGATTGVNLENWRAFLSSRPRPKDAGDRAADKPPEAGSLWQDPLFTDPAEGDFRVQEQSPAASWNLPSDEGAATP